MEYDINKKQKKLFKMIQKIQTKKCFQMTEKEINIANNREIPNNKFYKKLLGKKNKKVEVTSYIIPVDGGSITGYLYENENSRENTLKPLIVYIHGGGWVMGNMSVSSYFANHLVNRCGATVLSIDYRLAPKYKFPIAVEDCYRAVKWAKGGTRYWKIDPDMIYLLGDSAGGNLCASVSMLIRDRKEFNITGQILLYPVTDGRMNTPSYDKHYDSPVLTRSDMKFFINSYAKEPKDILDPKFSPLLAKDLSRLPETLIIVANNDPLRDDGVFYANALKQADTKVKLLEVKDGFHAFINYPMANGYKESIFAIDQYVNGKKLESIELISEKDFKKLKSN